MLDQETIDFCQNWFIKIDKSDSDNLSVIYDKYRDLFTIYNKLYNHLPAVLFATGDPFKGKITDSAGATDMVIQYLGGKKILENFHEIKYDKDIQAIINLINNEVFYIKVKNGNRYRKADLEISSIYNPVIVILGQMLY